MRSLGCSASLLPTRICANWYDGALPGVESGDRGRRWTFVSSASQAAHLRCTSNAGAGAGVAADGLMATASACAVMAKGSPQEPEMSVWGS
jgi:hypothetical protein